MADSSRVLLTVAATDRGGEPPDALVQHGAAVEAPRRVQRWEAAEMAASLCFLPSRPTLKGACALETPQTSSNGHLGAA